MNISEADLLAEYERAKKAMPWLHSIEGKHNLPDGLLYAIGSRESNLNNEFGDAAPRNGKKGPYEGGNWAVSPWQLDAGSYGVHPEWINDREGCADRAGGQLAGAIAQAEREGYYDKRVHIACSAYNAGFGGALEGLRSSGDPDQFTTGHDYGADVLERLAVVHAQHIKDNAAAAKAKQK